MVQVILKASDYAQGRSIPIESGFDFINSQGVLNVLTGEFGRLHFSFCRKKTKC